MNTLEARIKSDIREIPDFPKPGIGYKDITTLLDNPERFAEVIDAFKARYAEQNIDHIVAIESRGFIFGAPLAYALGVGLSLVRKPGKLPYKCHSVDYALEYGRDTVEMHIDAVKEGGRVLVIDDLLATGGTAAAACKLVEACGGEVVECAFLVELAFINAREAKLKDQKVFALATY